MRYIPNDCERVPRVHVFSKMCEHAFAQILSVFICMFSFTERASATVFQVSLGYGLGGGTAKSISSLRAEMVSQVVFPMFLNLSAEVGSENLRVLADGVVNYSFDKGLVDLSLWSVGARYFPLNYIEGERGNSVVSVGTTRFFEPYVTGAFTISTFVSETRDSDGLLQKVQANTLGGYVGVGMDLFLLQILSSGERFVGDSCPVLFLEGRFQDHPLGISQPTLETMLFSGFSGVRWHF